MNKKRKRIDYQKEYRRNMTDEQKQKLKDYQKEYLKNMSDEQKKNKEIIKRNM